MNKPERMPAIGVNRVLLIGTVSAGPWHNPASDGRAESCAFTLRIPEPGCDGQEYATFVRVETYGKVVPDTLELRQGDMVLAEGKLSWSKGTGEGKAALCVVVWRVLRCISDNPTTG